MYFRVLRDIDSRYLVDPLNPDAVKIMTGMEHGLPRRIFTYMNTWVVVTLSLAALAALFLGITIPEAWWQEPGTNDLYGGVVFAAMAGMAGACWWQGWIIEFGMTQMTKQFVQLVERGAIVKVPFIVRYRLEERLKEAGTYAYFQKSYRASPEDFAAIRTIAEAEVRGTIDSATETLVNGHLNQIVTRVNIKYEDHRAQLRGELEGLGEDPWHPEEG